MDIADKKRLMYIQSEDFYFLTYNTIILLQELKCVDGKFLKDYRKIAFLTDFVSNPYYTSFLKKETYSDKDKNELTRLYSNGILREKEINKLFYSLENRGIITLERNSKKDEINISLNSKMISPDFLDTELFEVEIRNAKIIKTSINRLISLKLESLITKIFIEKGVKIWQLF